MDIELYLAPLRKWWWLLIVSVMLAAGTSYYMVLQQPSTYQATATLIVGRTFTDPNPDGSELYLGMQLAQTYADLAQRRQVREQTMTVLGLDALPNYFPHPVPNSQLLEIIVEDTDPQRAQVVANELADQVILQSPTAPRPEEQERSDFIEGQLANLQIKIEETESEILEKQNQLDAAFSAREISDLGGDIAALQSKLDTLQGNYASMLSSTSEGAINTVSIYEPAALPLRPTGPAKARTMLSASAIALALAIGTAYLLEYLDDRIKTNDDICRATGIPSLPSIPEYVSETELDVVVALKHPRAPETDAFRALRAVVQTKTNQEAAKFVLVSGAKPGEGKSSVAANLAVVLAQVGIDVLLVDADLRRGRQHKFFGVSGKAGVTNVLLDYSPNGAEDNLEALVDSVVQTTAQNHLDILVSGRSATDGSQLLGLETMGLILAEASENYEYIVIDSPPLLVASDAMIISADVTAVLLVVTAGKTRRKELQQALAQLQEVGANVIGIVLNRVKASGGSYYYRYRDYYEKPDDSPEEEDLELIHQNGKEIED